jgi:hypothetical protein
LFGTPSTSTITPRQHPLAQSRPTGGLGVLEVRDCDKLGSITVLSVVSSWDYFFGQMLLFGKIHNDYKNRLIELKTKTMSYSLDCFTFEID